MNKPLSEKGYTIPEISDMPNFCLVSDIKQALKALTPKLFHDIYEEEAKKNNWNTQESCKVEFEDLPEENRIVMENTVRRVKEKIFGSLADD